MEWWNGLLEWNTGMDWDKIFSLAYNLKSKSYMDQVDRYLMTNYVSTILPFYVHIWRTLFSTTPNTST